MPIPRTAPGWCRVNSGSAGCQPRPCCCPLAAPVPSTHCQGPAWPLPSLSACNTHTGMPSVNEWTLPPWGRENDATRGFLIRQELWPVVNIDLQRYKKKNKTAKCVLPVTLNKGTSSQPAGGLCPLPRVVNHPTVAWDGRELCFPSLSICLPFVPLTEHRNSILFYHG